jgi:subtilase family serine protease
MKSRTLSALVFVTLFGAMLSPGVTLAATSAKVANNTAPWLSQAKLVRHANPTGQMTISLYLNLRNEAGLRQFLANVSRPGSAQYRHFLTSQQFRAAYSPAAATLTSVKSFLSARGLKVTYAPANGMYVDATGSVTQIEKAFAVTENVYTYSNKSLRANAQAPTIPSTLASSVSFIGGLDDTEALYQPQLDKAAPPGVGYSTPGPCSTYWADHSATITPAAYQYGATLPWTPCGYTPQQIRAAYGIDATGLTGAGVRVGVTDAFASPTILQDVNRFSAHYGLPAMTTTTLQQLVVPGVFNAPENPFFDPQGWFGEETLDVEWVHAMAPGAKIVYAGSQRNTTPLDHALIHMIDNHLVDVVTNSWGINGEYPHQYGHVIADERAFMQAAATGITVLFSSGDAGDVAASRGIAQASYPSSSPWVTSVGGTSLAVQTAAGAKDEWGWGTYTTKLVGSAPTQTSTTVTGTSLSPWPPAFQYGSGGGTSLHFAQPGYQAGVVPNALATTTTTSTGQVIQLGSPHRVTPDISMVGDPNTGVLVGETYRVSGDALIDAGCTPLGGGQEYCERRLGGTSLSSPLLAGVIALVDQARFTAGKGPIGFLNPAIYHGTPIGAPDSHVAIEDVLAPASPTAILRNVENADGSLTTTVRTINSVPVGTTGPVIEGADTSLRTTAAYDNVTGLGAPYAPAFVAALAAH